MTGRELTVQVYLAERESELGEFTLSLIRAKSINRAYFLNERKPSLAERFQMDEREKLFAKFYNEEKPVVNQMSDLELNAHIELLGSIAFEARAKLTAASDEKRERAAKGKKTQGFTTSLQTDDLASEAINKIRIRGERLTKAERLKKQLMSTGMDEATAESILSAGTILNRVKARVTDSEVEAARHKPTIVTEETPSLFVNPFAPKTEPAVEVTIQEETNTIIIKETKDEPKTGFINPFQK